MDSKHVLLASAAVFAVIVLISLLLSENVALATNLLFIGILILIVPYSLRTFMEFKRLKAIEDEVPNFLRDMAESQRAGLTLLQSIRSAAKSDYGLFTPELQRLNNQLSWNIPLEDGLREMSKRLHRSKNIVQALAIIEQANKSGGDIEETMDALAQNMVQIKEVQEEKSALLNQQVVMMYAIFFIFLGITIVLIKFLVPLLQSQSDAGGFGFKGFTANPCALCIGSSDPACFGCSTFHAVAGAFDFGAAGDAGAYYKALFFTMIMVQGFFSGLIAGQIGSDSLVGGIKHSLIMVLAGFFIFILGVRIGFI